MVLFKTPQLPSRVSMTSADGLELNSRSLDAAELPDANRLEYRNVRSVEIFYISEEPEAQIMYDGQN
jgi:hypothetical protein